MEASKPAARSAAKRSVGAEGGVGVCAGKTLGVIGGGGTGNWGMRELGGVDAGASCCKSCAIGRLAVGGVDTGVEEGG